MIKRIYVEKKSGFNTEALALLRELQTNLEIDAITDLRVINRYDVDKIDEETFELAVDAVFSETTVDDFYREEIELGQYAFAYAYLPGQFDQRADSSEKCIKLLNGEVNAIVNCAKIIDLKGDLSDREIERIKDYVINPVDSAEVSMDKPVSLEAESSKPDDVKLITGFCDLEGDELIKFRDENGFAMSDKDIVFVQQHFRSEDRDPTITELKVIDTYWSDHCRHTTFNTKITDIKFEEGRHSALIKDAFKEYLALREEVYGKDTDRDISLMDLGTIGAKALAKRGLLEDLDVSEEVNACSIKVEDDKGRGWLVMFKNETHNHPTEIEPFGGAATCVGGAIRDPLSGRVYVYQAMRITGSGDPRSKETLEGKLSQYQITKGAAKGYSSYGNQVGVATGFVEEIYDEGYVAKRMEVGAVIGAAPAENVVRLEPKPGDAILLVGGRTGRDGCGGATGSSKEHDEESIIKAGAEVQKGNPPEERNIQRLFRRPEVAKLIKRCNDFGAGGVSVAVGELADSIDVDLDKVPKKYDGLDGTELAISESQERMAVVLDKDQVSTFIKYANDDDVEATQIAQVTDSGRFRMEWRGIKILDLSREFLDSNGVKQEQEIYVKNESGYEGKEPEDRKSILSCVSDLNSAAKKGLIDCFDSTIGRGTVLLPLGGKYQKTPSIGMASKLPSADTNTTTLMSYGFDPEISKNSPFHGGVYAVVDSVTKIIAMGGRRDKIRLSFQEYYEKLGPNPDKWAKPFSALLGALKMQLALGTPSIGGKDSMSGTFKDINVPPTLISFAVGIGDADKIVSSEFKKSGSKIVYVTTDWDKNKMLDIDQYNANMALVEKLISQGKILSANTIGPGGIFMSAFKMSLGNKIGAFLNNVTELESSDQDYGALLLEVDRKENVEKLFEGIKYKRIGRTTVRQEIAIELVDSNEEATGVMLGLSIDELTKRWEAPLEGIFPSKIKTPNEDIENISFQEKNIVIANSKLAKPRVVMPVFPGTNCEVDSKIAFEKAGAEVDTQLIRYMDLENSIKDFTGKIKDSQIIMIPGGFSGGDEPDGSAKFITAVFRNSRVREAVSEFLKRDSLMLGICNGFQALIKLGLLPYGEIVDDKVGQVRPTLTNNTIGRHVSTFVRTRITSNLSPWLAGVSVGDIFTLPISNGEGRFVALDEDVKRLIENGQVSSQYVDFDGQASMDIRYNPNGSVMAVESLTSLDGRILGKMAHSERIGDNLYKNIQGNFDQKIFESGVNWFK